MLAQRGTRTFPATDAHIDVVALRKDPTIAARDRAELDHDRALQAFQVDEPTSEVSLKGDTIYRFIGKIERPRRGPVGAVSADQKFAIDPSAVNARATFGDLRHGRAIPKVSADTHCLLDEEVIESPSLCHRCQRPISTAKERTTATEAQFQPVYDALHDRLWIKRQLPHRSDGYTAPARLIARESRLVQKQHADTLARQTVSRGRTRRTSPDDDYIELFHRAES
jgi:hypothetical protein